MYVSTLTTKYQATIPRPVREALALGARDRIGFIVERGGAVRLTKAPANLEELHALEATLVAEWGSADDDDAYADL